MAILRRFLGLLAQPFIRFTRSTTDHDATLLTSVWGSGPSLELLSRLGGVVLLERLEREKVSDGGRGREDGLASGDGCGGERGRGVRGAQALRVGHRERRRTWGSGRERSSLSDPLRLLLLSARCSVRKCRSQSETKSHSDLANN